MPQLSIIIPVWNLWEMTKNCLESIAKHCATDSLWEQLEIIVVDNGSTDATKEALAPTLRQLFGNNAQAITLPENYGFAKACNKGAKAAKAELLFFLNNDTLFTPNCLPPLIQALERNSTWGIVGPLLLFPNDTIQHAGICFTPTLELRHAHALLPAHYAPIQRNRSWQAITGAAMLLRAKLFWDCEGFHEGFTNGFEDLDLCCQVRSKALQLYIVGKSHMYHLASQTPGRFLHDDTNAALLGQRHPGAFRPDYHSIAIEDGLVPLLSPDFKLYFSLPKAKDMALTQVFTQNFDPLRCMTRLENEPYWLQGYQLLANDLEKLDLWEEALTYRTLGARLEPLQENFIALEKCAVRCKREDIVNAAYQCQQDVQNQLQNYTHLKDKALRLRQQAQELGDTALEQLLTTWYNTYIQQ